MIEALSVFIIVLSTQCSALQEAGVAVSFGNDDEAESAIHRNVALVDRWLAFVNLHVDAGSSGAAHVFSNDLV